MDDVDPWPKFAIWKYAVIPFMSGAVGWFTNWLALEMTFKPIEYRGYDYFRVKDQPWGLFGWQGIVPTNAEKMARTTVRLMTTKLFKLEDIFKKLDPGKFYEAAEVGLGLMIHSFIVFQVSINQSCFKNIVVIFFKFLFGKKKRNTPHSLSLN